MSYSVLILGAGPAGLSAAIFLRQRGISVTVADRRNFQASKPLFKVGESLPPDAKKMLEQLGVWEAFAAGPHLECYANKSYWFSENATYHDFMTHPVGHGWHIDRPAFENMLFEKTEALGTHLIQEITDTSTVFENDAWKVHLKQKNGSEEIQHFNFLIDATGRNSGFARKRGVTRLHEDQQLALTAFFKHNTSFEDTMSLVETTQNGWWYSAKIPNNAVAMAFFCKPAAEQRVSWLEEGAFEKLLSEAPNTLKRFQEGDFQLVSEKLWVDAGSSILEKLHGKGWLAIGDAAMTFDPIASHGLMMSMVSARDAADALVKTIAGDPNAIQAYESVLWATFQRYLSERVALFA